MKPLRIKNPTSERHIARLVPGQSLEILVDSNVQITIDSDLLTLLEKKRVGNNLAVIVEPVSYLLKHAHLSTHFLGTISVGKKSSILVYLAQARSSLSDTITAPTASTSGIMERQDVVTIVNPLEESLRIKPFEIIEFMYCSDYEDDLGWMWEPNPRFNELNIEEIYYDKSLSGSVGLYDEKKIFSPHPRDIFVEGSRIHHFWFRLDKHILHLLQHANCLTPQLGKDESIGILTIEGFAEKNNISDCCCVELFCDFSYKHYLHTKSLIDVPIKELVEINGRPPKEKIGYFPLKSYFPRKNLGLNRVKEVVINKLPTKSMVHGCTVVSLKVF